MAAANRVVKVLAQTLFGRDAKTQLDRILQYDSEEEGPAYEGPLRRPEQFVSPKAESPPARHRRPSPSPRARQELARSYQEVNRRIVSPERTEEEVRESYERQVQVDRYDEPLDDSWSTVGDEGEQVVAEEEVYERQEQLDRYDQPLRSSSSEEGEQAPAGEEEVQRRIQEYRENLFPDRAHAFLEGEMRIRRTPRTEGVFRTVVDQYAEQDEMDRRQEMRARRQRRQGRGRRSRGEGGVGGPSRGLRM